MGGGEGPRGIIYVCAGHCFLRRNAQHALVKGYLSGACIVFKVKGAVQGGCLTLRPDEAEHSDHDELLQQKLFKTENKHWGRQVLSSAWSFWAEFAG